MKKFKKIMAVLVAAIMVVAMTVPAWATTITGRLDGLNTSPSSGTITIANAEDGETYKIYRIFDLYSFTDDNVATSDHSTSERYSYMIDKDGPWFNFIKEYYSTAGTAAGVNGTAYFVIDETNPVKFTNTAAAGTPSEKTYYFVEGNTGFVNTNSTEIDEDNRAAVIALGSSAIVQAFAQDALHWAKDEAPYATPSSGVDPIVTITNARSTSPAMATVRTDGITSGGDAYVDGVSDQLIVPKMSLGYYLVESTIGTLVSLDTTNPNAVIAEKNDVPSITKKVKARQYAKKDRDGTSKKYPAELVDTIWVDNADYEIGAEVTFMTSVTVPYGAKGYALHDVLESGFTLLPGTSNANFKVYLTDSTGTTGPITADDDTYTITVKDSATGDGCDFEVAFSDTWLSSMKDGSVVEIEYKAELNADAVIYGENESSRTLGDTTEVRATGNIEDGKDNPKSVAQITRNYNSDGKNTNSAILTFGLKSGRGEADGSTRWAVATVDTFRTDIAKTEEGTGTYPLLAGARFKLYREKLKTSDGKTEPDLDVNDKPQKGDLVNVVSQGSGLYNVKATGETAVDHTNTFIESDGTNAIKFVGLEAGTYFLEEIKAPTGYNKIDGFYRFTITGDSVTNNGNAVVITANTNTGNVGKVTYTFVNGSGTEVSSSNGRTTAATNAFPNAVITGTDPKVYSTSSENQGGIQIINNSSTELPSTGGMGTTVLYIVGGMLVILAGAYLFFSRKKTA